MKYDFCQSIYKYYYSDSINMVNHYQMVLNRVNNKFFLFFYFYYYKFLLKFNKNRKSKDPNITDLDIYLSIDEPHTKKYQILLCNFYKNIKKNN